jgi:hypothetical protein
MLIDEAAELDEDEWQTLMAADGPVGQGAQAVRSRHGRN